MHFSEGETYKVSGLLVDSLTFTRDPGLLVDSLTFTRDPGLLVDSFTCTRGPALWGLKEARGATAKSKNVGDKSEMEWGRGAQPLLIKQ